MDFVEKIENIPDAKCLNTKENRQSLMTLADKIYAELEQKAIKSRTFEGSSTHLCSEQDVITAFRKYSVVPSFRLWQANHYWLKFSARSKDNVRDRLLVNGPHGDKKDYIVQRNVGKIPDDFY